jgi:hypothetical protein
MAIAPPQPVAAKKEQPFDARNAIKQEQGESAKKTPEQIIRNDIAKQGGDVEKMLKKLTVMLQDKAKVKLVQFGNTVFLVRQVEPGVVESHIFTEDSPARIGDNYKKLVMALKKEGMKKGYTYSDNPGFRRVAEMTGLPIKITQTTKQVGGQMKPVYLYEMDF